MKKIIITTKAILFSLICLLLSACAGQNPIPNAQEAITVNHIVIMPVSMVSKSTTSKSLNIGKSVLSGLIHDYFMGNEKISILSEAQAESYKEGNKNDAQQIKRIGQRLNADAVMTWQIRRYEEKDGGDYSVNHPSSVAFSYRLTDIATGKNLCGNIVDKTQDTLTGNLLSAKKFLHHGGKWISARQLTKEILNNKLQECSYLVPTTPPK